MFLHFKLNKCSLGEHNINIKNLTDFWTVVHILILRFMHYLGSKVHIWLHMHFRCFIYLFIYFWEFEFHVFWRHYLSCVDGCCTQKVVLKWAEKIIYVTVLMELSSVLVLIKEMAGNKWAQMRKCKMIFLQCLIFLDIL